MRRIEAERKNQGGHKGGGGGGEMGYLAASKATPKAQTRAQAPPPDRIRAMASAALCVAASEFVPSRPWAPPPGPRGAGLVTPPPPRPGAHPARGMPALGRREGPSPGDRLISELADAMAASECCERAQPSAERRAPAPAPAQGPQLSPAALFCPRCVAREACAFHPPRGAAPTAWPGTGQESGVSARRPAPRDFGPVTPLPPPPLGTVAAPRQHRGAAYLEAGSRVAPPPPGPLQRWDRKGTGDGDDAASDFMSSQRGV